MKIFEYYPEDVAANLPKDVIKAYKNGADEDEQTEEALEFARRRSNELYREGLTQQRQQEKVNERRSTAQQRQAESASRKQQKYYDSREPGDFRSRRLKLTS